MKLKSITAALFISAVVTMSLPVSTYAGSLPDLSTTQEDTYTQQDDTGLVTADGSADDPQVSSDNPGTSDSPSADSASDIQYTVSSIDFSDGGQGDVPADTVSPTEMSRFEVFYNSDGDAPVVNFHINGDTNVYQAAYGDTIPDGSPVAAVKSGQGTMVTSATGKQTNLSMIAIYFDPTRYQGFSSASISVVRGTGDTTIIFSQTQVPSDWETIVDGEETGQPVVAGSTVSYFLATASTVQINDIGSVLNITSDTASADAEIPHVPTTEEKIMNLLKMIWPVFIVIAALIVFLAYKKNNEKKLAAKNKEMERKAKRKRKEQRIRENDHLEEALNEYADDYSDDEYYEEHLDDSDESEEEGFSQIEQEHFTDYNTGIKEALHTMRPEEEEELKKRKEAILKAREKKMKPQESAVQREIMKPQMTEQLQPPVQQKQEPALTPVPAMPSFGQPAAQPVQNAQTAETAQQAMPAAAAPEMPQMPAFDTGDSKGTQEKSKENTLPSFDAGPVLPSFGGNNAPAAGFLI